MTKRKMSSRKEQQEYFAAAEDPNELAAGMSQKITEWRTWYASRGLNQLQTKKLKNYYGISQGGNTSMAVTRGGSEGELSLVKVNDLRNLIQHQLVIITSQRPAGIAKAINSDSKALQASRVGTAVAEFYMTQVGFEARYVEAAEIALVCDESFVEGVWDTSMGEVVGMDPVTGEVMNAGDGMINVHCPWFVARDPGFKVATQKWYIITKKANRFDRAKQYPKYATHILSCANDELPEVPMDYIPDGSDAIYEHWLIHDRTPSLPQGRYSLMIGGEIVLDTELPFKDFPVDRMAASDVIDACIGYAAANDILALEEVTDALHSIVVTNQVNFGGQCFVCPQNSGLKFADLAKGVRVFELPMNMIDKFKPLDLLHTPPEVFNYITMLGNKKDQTVGVSSVTKGQPEGQLAGASGSALALVQAQAISFNSGGQRAWFQLLGKSMTKFIRILAKWADVPRIAAIAGKSKMAGIKQFKYTGKDLQMVSSLVYEMVNPALQTLGGRMTLGDTLIKIPGMIKSPKQYIDLVVTGQPDVLWDDDVADQMLILEENEALIDGEDVDAIITEMHEDHIKSHMSLITNEAKKKDPGLVVKVTKHVLMHIGLWTEATLTNPGLLIATGQKPLYPPQQPGVQGPGPDGGPPPGAGGPDVGKSLMEPQGGGMPSLPKVAGTDEKAQVPGVSNSGAV